jgi:glycosyltransferase involved in cell wall biosynthesis
MSSPLVSVILPVRNAERYVGQAMESILRQTYGDFEIIAIDDGSTDHSLEILKKYASSDKRMNIVSRENRGLVASLNQGLKAARGQWIARMDADDIALPQRFERQLQRLEHTGADICGSWVKLFGADRRVIKHPQTDEAIKMKMIFCAPFTHPAVMMKTEMVRQLGYDKDWETCEDYDLWERATRAGWKMINIPEILLLYRQHKTQISTMALSMQQQLTQKIRRRYLEYVFDSMKLKKEWIDEVLKLREPLPSNPNMSHVDSAFTELLKKNNGEAQEIIFDHVTRLYFRAAANCPDVVDRWSRLNKNYGAGIRADIKIPLWMLSIFHVQPDSRLFGRLKRMYFRLIRSM